MTAFVDQYADICDYQLGIWNDDFKQKIMSVEITSKLNTSHSFRMGRIYGASISEDHFHLVKIGDRNLFCYLEDHQGKHVMRRKGIDVGRQGPFCKLLKIDSLECLVRRHDEIMDMIQTWPGSKEKHGILAVPNGRLRYYVTRLPSK